MSTEPKLEINPHAEVSIIDLNESTQCAVIDDFLINPRELIDFAREQRSEFQLQERAYPGLVLSVSENMTAAMKSFIQSQLSRRFQFCRGGMDLYGQLSMTTLQPENFTWIQRLCHTDPRLNNGRRNFAALLYLFDNTELGGTGFYRWKNPEFWTEMTTVQAQDPEAGLDLLKQKYQMFRDPPCYMTESNEAADLVQHVEARFNRLIFYTGEIPHNAYIQNPERLSDNPETGRLTLNCFASVIPKN